MPRSQAVAQPLSDRIEAVRTLAAQSAARHGHSSIGPTDVLLGILADGGGVAVAALYHLRVDLNLLRQTIETGLAAAAGNSPASMDEAPPLPPGLIATAAASATALGHGYVGTEHLLLALADTSTEWTVPVLPRLGVTHAAVTRVLAMLLGSPSR